MQNEKAPSSYKKLFSNTLVFAIGSFSSKVLVLLLIPIYTYALSTTELGITDVLTQIANWIIPLASLTISEAIIRFGLDKAYDKRAVFTIGNIVCGCGLGIFAILLPIVSISGIADKYIGNYSLILYLYVFMSSLKTLYSTFVRAMERVKLFALNGIITTFFTLFFTAMFYIVLPKNFLGENTGITKYLLAILLSDFISVVFLTVVCKLWKYIDIKHLDRELMHTMLQYSVPLIPAQLLWLITNSSDSFMTTHYLGSDYNGILSAAYKIPNIVATVYMMFGQAWNMSAITENDSKDRNRFYENVFDFNQSLLYMLAGGCLLIIQPLTNIMIGGNFRDCINYSPLLIYSSIFSCFTTFMGSIYLASRKTKRSLFTSLISGVINVGLNVILIPRIGLYGPAISTVVAYMTVFVVRAIDSRKLVPFKMNIRKLVVNNIILLIMLFINHIDTNIYKNNPALLLVLIMLLGLIFLLNVRSLSSLFHRYLPARIADRIDNLNWKKLLIGFVAVCVLLIGLVTLGRAAKSVAILWVFVIAAGIVLSAISVFIGKTRLCYALVAAFTLICAIATGISTGIACGLLMMIIPSIKMKNIRCVLIVLLLTDLLIALEITPLLSIICIIFEGIALCLTYKNELRRKINNFVYKK